MKKLIGFLILAIAGAAQAAPLKLYDADHEQYYQAVQGQGTTASPYVTGSTILDREGKSPMSTVFGELTVGQRNDDISVEFQYSNAPDDVVITTSGTASAANASSMSSVSTGAGVGTASIHSNDSLRYRPGHEAVAMFTSIFSAGETGVTQKHGLINGTDGVAFGKQGTVFGAWFESNDVETFTPQTSFSEDHLDGSGPSGCDITPEFMNIYKISYGWLGIAPITYSVYCGHDLGWVSAHVVDLTNSQATPSFGNPSLPIMMEISRASGSGADLTMFTSSWRAGVVGEASENNASNRWKSHTIVEAPITAAGARNAVMTICNKSTYQGKTNHVSAEIANLELINEGNKSLAFYLVNNATVSGAGASTDVDTENSTLTHSFGGTITAGTRGKAFVRAAGAGRRDDILGRGARIYPNNCVTIEAVATAAFAGTATASADTQEKF